MNFSHLLLMFYIFFSSLSYAKQTSFNKKVIGDKIQFNYQWIDYKRKLQNLNFVLAKTAVFDRFRQFKTYKSEFSEAYIHRELQTCIQKQPLKGVRVVFNKVQGHTKINIRGKNPLDVNNAYGEIEKLQSKFFDQYLAKNNYQRFTNYNGVKAVKPDHVNIAAQSVKDLAVFKKLVLEKVAVENIRKVSDFVLSFVQSIPYSKLESRITSSGAGFVPPLTLLFQNQGDCDSKVTLTAAILRALMPRINMVIVYIKQHALFGIELMPEGDELSINVDGSTYLLSEPTGPASYPLGQVAEVSKQAILAGLYSTDKFK
ncbi:MAG: hypothetical protein JKX78_11090 [Alteromonadaceae bacterium]|nr:hypothetical protein [Alteromonadaceae bacterium]